MSVRINYKTYPTDYVQQLNTKRGVQGRKKSRAFLEYWNDMEHGEHNSIRFYAKSWEVSASTSHSWIDEFNKEIDLFLAHWTLKNNRHYNSVQNSAEHQPNKTNTCPDLNLGVCDEAAEHQPNEVFNINNNNNKGEISFYDSAFEDMYLRCRFSSKFTGNKEAAYIEYQKHKHIKENDMAYAYMLHVNDPTTKGKTYNLMNFMKQNAYLNYLNPQIEIKKDGKTIIGYYNQETDTVKTDKGTVYTLEKSRFTTLVASGEIIITNKVRAA